MSKSQEIEEKILELSDEPESFKEKFDELVEILKSNPKEKITKILKDDDLTKIIEKAIKTNKFEELSEYIKSITEEGNKNFSDLPPVMVNFAECSLGMSCERIPEEVSQTKDNVCEEVLLDTPGRKIKVKQVNSKNFGFIIDTTHTGYNVKSFNIDGDYRDFSNWKMFSKKSMTKESLDDLLK
jgi:hypothetical protein